MGQISFFEGGAPLRIKKKVRLIELFSGIGAQAASLERLGIPFEHYRTSEIEKNAVISYNNVHGTNFDVLDIKDMRGDDLGIVEKDKYCYVLTYSYPCQSLSLAGRRQGMVEGSGTESALLWEVKRLLDETKELPDILLMENVPQVIDHANKPEFDRWCEYLTNRGYINKYDILNVKDYGVPQNRRRCYMVSWLDNTDIGCGEYYYDFPTPIPLNRRVKNILEEEVVDERFYLTRTQVKRLEEGIGAETGDSQDEFSVDELERDMRGWEDDFDDFDEDEENPLNLQ